MFENVRANAQIEMKLDGVNIKRVSEIKFLIVITDDKSCWKVSKSIARINKAKHILDHKSLLSCSLVLSYFNNCADVWCNNYNATMQ